ncbi:hypothetical protein DFI02_104307 [Rhizobium sp. PP-F2F-G20b]|nr:hypothetical protein DFI02_104307 [Rhizobium sp. PP-F2F-G20b]
MFAELARCPQEGPAHRGVTTRVRRSDAREVPVVNAGTVGQPHIGIKLMVMVIPATKGQTGIPAGFPILMSGRMEIIEAASPTSWSWLPFQAVRILQTRCALTRNTYTIGSTVWNNPIWIGGWSMRK